MWHSDAAGTWKGRGWTVATLSFSSCRITVHISRYVDSVLNSGCGSGGHCCFILSIYFQLFIYLFILLAAGLVLLSVFLVARAVFTTSNLMILLKWGQNQWFSLSSWTWVVEDQRKQCTLFFFFCVEVDILRSVSKRAPPSVPRNQGLIILCIISLCNSHFHW